MFTWKKKETDRKENKKEEKMTKKEWIRFILLLVIVYISAGYVVPTFAADKAIVDGESMEMNYYDGDSVIADKLVYKLTGLDRFDVILLYPYGRVTDDTPVGFVQREFMGVEEDCYIKRVIGLPGETVQIVGSDILINGEVLEESYGKDPISRAGVASEPITLEENEYFVLGDNRTVSEDSRTFGPVSSENICGRVILRY